MGNVKYYDLKQVTEILPVSKKTLERMIAKGKITATKFSSKWMVSEKTIAKYLESRTVKGEV